LWLEVPCANRHAPLATSNHVEYKCPGGEKTLKEKTKEKLEQKQVNNKREKDNLQHN
jgi:hypothetical protein